MGSEIINKKLVILFICFVFISSPPFWLSAKSSLTSGSGIQTVIALDNGAKALEYLPKNFNPNKRYPMIMALHGMGQSAESAMRIWKPIADKYHMILVCPVGSNFSQGYTRAPVDDRKLFVEFRNLVDQRYNVDLSKSVLAGFSRGGNFAIETGILYPTKFRNIICICGFFNNAQTGISKALAEHSTQGLYQNSAFYFVTSEEDATYHSLKLGYNTLNHYNIRSQLGLYPKLVHSYPPGLSLDFKTIYKFLIHTH
ncbi:alpha/beta hydrolase-fold protein [Thermoproteota archaeon]